MQFDFGRSAEDGEDGVGVEFWEADGYEQEVEYAKLSQRCDAYCYDCDVKSFGFDGDSFWREVFGCQRSFDASDKYIEVRTLEWDVPCIWTCNEDLDPRKVEEVASYVSMSGSVVYEVGTNKL